MTMQLPTVKEANLRAFHAKHFPAAPLPAQFFPGAEAAEVGESYVEEDDGLGYYNDGVKRTLTDEEVAFMRKREIRAILMARRKKNIADAETAAEATIAKEAAMQHASVPAFSMPKPSPAVTDSPDSVSLQALPPAQRSCSAVSSSSASTPLDTSENGPRHGRIEKRPGNRDETKFSNRQSTWKWKETSTRTQEKNRRARHNHRRNKKEKKQSGDQRQDRAQGGRSEREGSIDGESSDEWDPRRQATGPDAIQSTTVELDY